MTWAEATQRRLPAGGDSTVLIAGALISGAAAYGYLMMGTRWFGQAALAPTTVVWSAWAMGAAALTLPVEQWLARIRQIPALSDTASGLRRLLWLVSIALFIILGGGAWIVRERLFSHSGWQYPVIFGLTWLGAVAMGITRGSLSASRRFKTGAWLLAGENLLRLALGGVVLVTNAGVVLFTTAIPAGSLTALVWLRKEAGATDQKLAFSDMAPLLALTGASLIAQLVLTGGPIAAALLQATPAAVTGLFTAMAICRIPYQVLPGFSGKLSVVFTRLWLQDAEAATRRLVRTLLMALAVVPPLGGLIAWTAGNPLIRLLFGGVEVPRITTTTVAVASGVAMVAFVASLGLMAIGRTRNLLLAWLSGLAAAAITLLSVRADVSQRTAWAFLAGEIVALMCCVLVLRSASQRTANY